MKRSLISISVNEDISLEVACRCERTEKQQKRKFFHWNSSFRCEPVRVLRAAVAKTTALQNRHSVAGNRLVPIRRWIEEMDRAIACAADKVLWIRIATKFGLTQFPVLLLEPLNAIRVPYECRTFRPNTQFRKIQKFSNKETQLSQNWEEEVNGEWNFLIFFSENKKLK